MKNLIENIESFYIFSTKFENSESNDSGKIIYFYPHGVSSDVQKTQVGLSEAVIKFMSTFSIEPCEVLQTQTKKYIFYEPEKTFWMVMVINRPYTTKPLSASGDSKYSIEPSIIIDVTKCAYRMIRMFLGPLNKVNHEEISLKCQEILPVFLSSKKLCDDIHDVFQGINYLSLDKKHFFKVLCFIDLIEVSYSDFKCVSFLHNNQLIWNSLESTDMLCLYQYLVDMVLPDQIQQDTQSGSMFTSDGCGRLILLETHQDENQFQQLPKVYLKLEDTEVSKFYYFILYCHSRTVISFLVDESKDLQLETLRSLDSFIGPKISDIALSLNEELVVHTFQNTNLIKNDNEKYLYFNKVNLAVHSSINTKTQEHSVNPEVLSIVADMHRNTKSLSNHGEITIKTPDEYWITGKSSNEREFYVIIQERDANLKDISDKVKRVCDAQMKNKFFYPI